VLENRQVRPVGSSLHRPVDVRIVAATNRDLRSEVNAGRFRSDLFFRLSIVRITMPPLRQRPDDVPFLVSKLLRRLGADESTVARFCEPTFVAGLTRAAWPGNVRELRNYLERCLVFEEPMPFDDGHVDGGAAGAGGGGGVSAPPPVDASLPYAEARREALDGFEQAYVRALLTAHGGRVAAAARAAGIDRVYLYRLMRRHGAPAPHDEDLDP
jgi:two-component system response regulator GlrR